MGELKSSGDITNSLLKALNAENGLDLKALTARLSSSEQEALETNLIRGVIEKFTKDGITDFSKVSNTLKNAPFESKRAVEIMGELNKKAPILNNTSSLLEKLTAINPKAKELQQGIGHSVTGALMTMKRNLAIERLKSLLPVLGNDASLKNHIRNAINNAGDLKSVINNLEKIEIKDAPENSTKLLEAFKNEVKALREEAQTGEIKGDGFVVKNGGKLTFMDKAKFELSKELQGKSDLGEKISTSLAWLHSKHPEMFENKRAVKELIDYVLDEPNTIKAGKSENSVYLGKKDGTKIKDIVVNKSENKIIHANRRRMSTDEIKADGKDAHIPLHTDTMPAGATGANARSSADESIISQKDKNTKTINASPHIASGLLGGTANGADENGNVSPEEFAKGFIYALFGSKFSASAVKRISPELYNSILGLGKKMPQMAKDNPKLLTKIYGSAKSNSINSFAGEKALNASANKLSKAKAMLEKGEDEVKIWQSTGWYKDKDGAWKFEIDDSPAKIKNQNADKLGDLLEHKELFKAYPELKDIKIKKIIDEKVEKLGYYDPNKKEIAINNIGDKLTLMHEVQRAIQDIEGFARGGEYDIVWNAAVRTIEKKYESELAKLEKIANEAWKKEEPLQKAYIELFDKGLKDSPEAQRLLKEREPYSKKGWEANNKIRNIKWAIEDEKNAINDKDMYEAYQKIHGEVEARNVQNRLNLNKKDRVYPHETFDVNPNDTFVSREDGVNFSQKLPELKEKRGIYNVTYNGKFSTPVYKDLTTIDDAIKYAKGDKSKGAKHIEIKHLEDTTKEGYVTKQELLNMGENMRKFIKEYKEPFINDRKARLYEWEDKDGARFRLVINDIKDKNGGSGIHSAITSTSANDDIITFYSDRNLKEPMKFENPKLKLLDVIDNSSDKVGLVKKVLLNKDISDGVKAKAVNRLTKNKISQATKNSYISTKNSENN